MNDINKVIEALENADVTYGVIKMSDEFRDILVAVLKEQEQDVQNLIADLGDLRKEHEKLLDKKIPLITSGQEVIRCKDCKYWQQLYGDKPFYSSIGCCYCDDMWRSLDGEATEVNDIRTDSDFYCGYADRK